MSKKKSADSLIDQNRPQYLLNIYLQHGKNLAVKDASGSSDPYVKFFYKNKVIYRSHTIFKSINPQWDEKLVHIVDDINEPLRLEVYDYDRFSDDDFMGCAKVDLSTLDDSPTQTKVVLIDKKNTDRNYPGHLVLTLSLAVASGDLGQVARYHHSSLSDEIGENGTRSKRRSGVRKASKMWTDLVRVVLVEAKNLIAVNNKTDGSAPDTYVKFKLGEEKHKSKIYYQSWNPVWLEQFSLHTRNDHKKELEVVVTDSRKDVAIGRCTIDLNELAVNKVHKKWYHLDNGASKILLTIQHTVKLASRVAANIEQEGAVVDLKAMDDPETTATIRSYGLQNTLRVKDIWNVGYLVVRVYRARGLAASDIGNTSDPFCVVELVNARMETHTEYKTLNPEWNTVFTFYVSDIHSLLELTVYDEDRYTKSEFLGKVAVPLLNVKSNEKVWYPLRNEKLTRRAKGEILVEMNVAWNPVRAAVATFLPVEPKYGVKAEPFRRRRFIRNIERLNRFLLFFYGWYQYYQLCISWESPQRSLMAFVFSMIMAYCLQPSLIPLGILMLFVCVFLLKQSQHNELKEELSVEDPASDLDDSDDDATDEKNWKIIRGYVQQRNLSLSLAQNMTDFAATLLEKAKNVLEFKQPFVSWLAIFCLLVSTIVLYFIPIQWIAMAWVIKKFSRKYRRPYSVHSNEVLDLVSRAPSDADLITYHGYKEKSR